MNATAVTRTGARLGYLLGLILGVCGLGLSAAGIANPDIAAALGVSKASTAWVVNCFALGLGVGTIVTGRLLDLVPRAGVLYVSAAVMLAGAAVCAAAGTFEVLLAGRVLLGIGAGGLCSFAFVLGSSGVAPEARSRVAGLMTATSVAFIGAGPLLGALSLAVANWRLAVALPASAAVIAVAIGGGGDQEARPPAAALDLAGILIVTVLAACLAGALQSPGTSVGLALTVPLAAGTLAAAGALAVHVRRRPDGFLPRELLLRRRLVALNLSSMTLLGAYAGMLYAGPQLLDAHTGIGTVAIGAALAPAALTASYSAHLAGAILLRRDPATMIGWLCVAGALGLLVAGVAAAVPVIVVAATAVTASVFAAGQVTMQVSAPVLVPAGQVGAALGLFNFCFISGAAFGTSAAAGVSRAAGFTTALVGLAAIPVLGALIAFRASPPSV
ncbi:MAG: transporter, family, metal-tetracycline-proton antiporter [Solirubrobacteraceae bacterium]|nr:transporter, family, metal-tetracycline-proton antiporter [Solirubrobacteraceae bacterium]